ncbi:tetratricopeptide repeat protein [Pendulispora albinea]|uniref:Tetratricopeptide repeat protein n=1 Tax=Pendulispora albinea TaxID=2741071 RepID=A0ABZ2M1D0_9BACT
MTQSSGSGGGEDSQRWVDRAIEALDRGQPESAIDLLRNALTFDPNDARAHALLSYALLESRRIGAALVEARAAVALDPNLSVAHLVLGDAWLAHRKPQRAREHFDAAHRLDPSRPAPLRGLARFEAFYDRDDAAIELLDRALSLDPEDPETLVELGQAHLGRGHLDEAERYARAALELSPEQSNALVIMGHVLLRRGDVGGAREHAGWAIRAGSRIPALNLIAAIKARESLFLGVWFRLNSMLAELGPKAMLVLLAAYVAQRFLILVLQDLGHPRVAELVSYAWLGLCVYSWVAPGIFQRMLLREIRSVRLRGDF